jgi:hypothetical protein
MISWLAFSTCNPIILVADSINSKGIYEDATLKNQSCTLIFQGKPLFNLENLKLYFDFSRLYSNFPR